jgi:zinc transporter
VSGSEGSALLHACLLDGSGGARELDPGRVAAWQRGSKPLWLHLDFTKGDVDQWMDGLGLPDVVLDELTDPETRPRSLSIGEGLLVILRGVNMNPGQDPEDMVSIRVWVENDLVVTSRRRKLLAVQDIRTSLAQGDGPKTAADVLVHLISRLADRIGTFVDHIEEELLVIEERMTGEDAGEQRRPLSELRRQIANVRRFVAPQRDALDRLYRNPGSWMTDAEVQELREEADRITRYVEDLDLARERAIVLHEEYQGLIAQQQNNRMYVLSIVAAVFLPLTFVTGLLGMNVGGLPGVESDTGFVVSVVVMLLCAIAAALVLRWKKWM